MITPRYSITEEKYLVTINTKYWKRRFQCFLLTLYLHKYYNYLWVNLFLQSFFLKILFPNSKFSYATGTWKPRNILILNYFNHITTKFCGTSLLALFRNIVFSYLEARVTKSCALYAQLSEAIKPRWLQLGLLKGWFWK